MTIRLPSRRTLFSDTAILIYLAAAKFLLHMAVSSQYGYFRDELYYIAASKRLAFGYVDFPPLVAWLTALVRATLGESLPALHLLPALAGAGLVFLAGRMARAFGAGRFGQALAALCVAVAPVFLALHSLLTMDCFEQLFWGLSIYTLILLLRDDRPSLWLVFGLSVGLSLTAKISILYLGLALVLGLLLTPARKNFKRWQLWAAGAVALGLLLPYILWNASHGFPTLDFWARYGDKLFRLSPVEFLFQQILVLHPLFLPVWLAGLIFFFLPSGKLYRPLGWMYMILLVVLMIQNAKNYFLAPYYPVLFAAGALQVERFFAARNWGWVRPAALVLVGLAGLAVSPMAMPILPIEPTFRFNLALSGIELRSENNTLNVLPQHLADRFGWPELADTMAALFRQLPPEDQAKACIVTANYGEAGALEFFGPSRGLPPVISGHNSYYLWGPGQCTGEVILYLGITEKADLQQTFESVELVGATNCRYCMPYENSVPIYLCKGIKVPIEAVWLEVKHFI